MKLVLVLNNSTKRVMCLKEDERGHRVERVPEKTTLQRDRDLTI